MMGNPRRGITQDLVSPCTAFCPPYPTQPGQGLAYRQWLRAQPDGAWSPSDEQNLQDPVTAPGPKLHTGPVEGSPEGARNAILGGTLAPPRGHLEKCLCTQARQGLSETSQVPPGWAEGQCLAACLGLLGHFPEGKGHLGKEGREGEMGRGGCFYVVPVWNGNIPRIQDLTHTSIVKLYQALDMQGEARQESGGGHIRVTLGNK